MKKSLFYTICLIALTTLLFAAAAEAQFCEKREAKPAVTSIEQAPSHVPDKAVESEVENENIWSNSLDQAAIKALSEASVQARDRKGIEYGGCLYADSKENPTKFYYTIPVTNHSPDGIRVSCKTPHYARAFVGLYHTHPIDLTIDGFSGHDIDVAEALNVTSYVGSLYSKNILRFESCKTRKVCLEDGGSRCYRKNFSRGENIGRIDQKVD